MPLFLGGPTWPEIDTRLAAFDFPGALQEAQRTTSVTWPERRLVVGICHAMFHQADLAEAALLESFTAFRDDPARATVAAVFIGRMHHFLHDRPLVAAGWFARARTLATGLPDCIERGLAALPLPGCDMVDVSRLSADGESTLAMARRLGNRDLEAKALADLGIAQVSLGELPQGMARLDEAMAMVTSGESASPFVQVDVVCTMLTACARAGDLGRADEWTHAAERQIGFDVERGPGFLYAHCRSALGLILCDIGRWDAAEATLRLASVRGVPAGPRSAGQAHAALAELWLHQGRLEDAEQLLAGRQDHPDALLPAAQLRLLRHQYDDAVELARRGARAMGGDRMRRARLLGVAVQAELGRGDLLAAAGVADELQALSVPDGPAVLAVRANLAQGLVAQASGDLATAATACRAGLEAAGSTEWPLLRAELQLGLARALASTNADEAVSRAGQAYAVLVGLGSPMAATAAALLRDLGAPVVRRRHSRARANPLSPREQEVLLLVRDGLTNAEIATRLHNSVRTIDHHVGSILQKLHFRSRTEAAVYAASIAHTVQSR